MQPMNSSNELYMWDRCSDQAISVSLYYRLKNSNLQVTCVRLQVNLLFLMSIVWTLVKKLRASNSSQNCLYRQALCTTIVIIRLFSIRSQSCLPLSAVQSLLVQGVYLGLSVQSYSQKLQRYSRTNSLFWWKCWNICLVDWTKLNLNHSSFLCLSN